MVARETAEQVLFVILFQLTSIHLPCTVIYCNDVARANDAGRADVTAFTSTGCKTIFENPRDYIYLYRHETWLWVQRARERFVALLLTAKDPEQMQTICTLRVQGYAICMPSIPIIFAIA